MQFEQVGTKSLNCSGFAMNDNERPLFSITKNRWVQKTIISNHFNHFNVGTYIVNLVNPVCLDWENYTLGYCDGPKAR